MIKKKEFMEREYSLDKIKKVNFFVHLLNIRYISVIIVFGLITSYLIESNLLENIYISIILKTSFTLLLCIVVYTYKESFFKRIIMFILAWLLYTIIVGTVAYTTNYIAIKLDSTKEVENYIVQIVENSKKIDFKVINGIKTLKIEKIDKTILKETSQFMNLKKVEIFTPFINIEKLKAETIDNLRNSICKNTLLEQINKGLVYQIEQYDKNMVLLMSAKVEKDCNIEVKFYK